MRVCTHMIGITGGAALRVRIVKCVFASCLGIVQLGPLARYTVFPVLCVGLR